MLLFLLLYAKYRFNYEQNCSGNADMFKPHSEFFASDTHDLHPGMTPLSRFADSQPKSLWISIEARNSSAKTGINAFFPIFSRAFSTRGGTRLAAQRSVAEDSTPMSMSLWCMIRK